MRLNTIQKLRENHYIGEIKCGCLTAVILSKYRHMCAR